MKTRLMIPALLAAATFSASAFAHGGDRDDDWRGHRGWQEQRHDHWRHHHRHDHWRYDHRPPPPPYAYGYGYGYRPAPRVYYEAPAVHLPLPPLPPPPHEVLRDILRGH
jgi:hypothetical protein